MVNLDSADQADLHGYAATFRLLAIYAERKAKAMAARKAGLIRSAERLERECEGIFNTLPDWARW